MEIKRVNLCFCVHQNENHQTMELNLPNSVATFKLTVHEEMDGREDTVRDFAARCSGIIMEAIKWAPETTRSILQVRIPNIKLRILQQ